MTYENVSLWFAKDEDENIITVNEVNKEETNTYYCPLCGSAVIPRQGEKMSWHFAHIDKSKCDSESMYHFWVKNKLIEKGDSFIVKSDVERKYVCKDILIEQNYRLKNNKHYKPDLSIITECGETIYFEMDYTNTKKIEDYMDIWIELENIVVEVDIKTLINSQEKKLPVFKAKYYNEKCFNVKKGIDNSYYEIIGKYKEELIKDSKYNIKKKEIDKLDWLWKDIQKYNINEVDIEHISELIQGIDEKYEQKIVVEILKRNICNTVLEDYISLNIKILLKMICEVKHKINKDFSYSVSRPHFIYDRVYGKYYIHIKYQSYNEFISFNVLSKDTIKLLNVILDSLCKIETTKELFEFEQKQQDHYKKMNGILKTLQNFRIPLNYSDLCDDVDQKYFPKISYWKQSRLYLNNFKHCCKDYFITINKFNNEEEANELMLNAIGNLDEYFTKEDIIIINKTSKDLKSKYKNDIQTIIKGGYLLKIKYKNRIVFERCKNDFYLSNLYKMVCKNVKSYKNKDLMEKKQERIDAIKSNEKYLKRLRCYKLEIISQLKKTQYNISKILPSCNKPYLIVKYSNNINHVFYLSGNAYKQYYVSLNEYDVVTILNKENEFIDHIDFKFEIDNRILFVNNEGEIKFIKKCDLFDNIIFNYRDLLNKNVNIFYYKNKPKNKKYKNLNKFDFVGSLYRMKNINPILMKIEMINSCCKSLNISKNEIIERCSIIKMREFVLHKLDSTILEFIDHIKSVRNKEVNLLFNIKYTFEENVGYQPWLVEDFIEELYRIGFKNINITNIKCKEEWHD